MHMIVYTSRATDPEKFIINDIVGKSASKNAKKEITGALFYDNGTFLQVLEGNREQITQLMEIIHKDPRHTDLNVLIDQPIQQRTLENWSLQQINLKDISAFHELNLELFNNAIQNLVKPRADQFIASLKSIFSSPDVNRLLLETI